MEIYSVLVGVNFRSESAKEVVDQLEIGDTLELEREPENPFDSGAVKVYAADEFIGYIPKADNVEIAAALDEGQQLMCEVVSWAGHRRPGLKITAQP